MRVIQFDDSIIATQNITVNGIPTKLSIFPFPIAEYLLVNRMKQHRMALVGKIMNTAYISRAAAAYVSEAQK